MSEEKSNTCTLTESSPRDVFGSTLGSFSESLSGLFEERDQEMATFQKIMVEGLEVIHARFDDIDRRLERLERRETRRDDLKHELPAEVLGTESEGEGGLQLLTDSGAPRTSSEKRDESKHWFFGPILAENSP